MSHELTANGKLRVGVAFAPAPTPLFIVKDADGRLHFGPAVRFKDEPSQPVYREPLLGEHTDEVLKRAGR